MMKNWIAALAGAALVLAACGGGADRTKANVRLVNASLDYTSLDLVVDGQTREGSVTYGSTADYVEIDPSKTDSSISQTNSATALLSFTQAVTKGSYYTLLAYGALGALKEIPLDDNSGTPDTNKSLLRIINVAPDAGSLDVYLTGSSDLLASSVPVLSGATLGNVGTWLTINSGAWRLRMTAAGSKTDVRLDIASLTLDSKQIATLVATPGRGGALVNALLLNQQGGIVRLDSPLARVRVAAGLASGGAVTAKVGGTTLLNGTSSPVVGLYQSLASGDQAVALSVNGTALDPATVTLAAGGDYTLLVYGAVAAPVPVWVEDDNRLSTDTTLARVRLVNGVTPLTTPLSLTIDGLPLADGVAPGKASDYGLVAASTTAGLSVTASGLPAPVFTATTQTFIGGGNYTLFVLGADGAAAGILRKDR